MKKSRWIKPYTTNAKGRLVPTIRDCWTCAQAGVYMIRRTNTGEIVYIGSSTTQLKKTIYRHFQEWTDRQKKNNRQFERKTYPKDWRYEIRFIKCPAAQALRLEKFLIVKNEPKDNPLKYSQLTKAEYNAGEKLNAIAADAPIIAKEDYTAPF